MKPQHALLAAVIVLTSVGCRSVKPASRAAAPQPEVASFLYYDFDESFRSYFGPEGIAAIERQLREANVRNQIQLIPSEPENKR